MHAKPVQGKNTHLWVEWCWMSFLIYVSMKVRSYTLTYCHIDTMVSIVTMSTRELLLWKAKTSIDDMFHAFGIYDMHLLVDHPSRSFWMMCWLCLGKETSQTCEPFRFWIPGRSGVCSLVPNDDGLLKGPDDIPLYPKGFVQSVFSRPTKMWWPLIIKQRLSKIIHLVNDRFSPFFAYTDGFFRTGDFH